ncbi:hypothetical protein FPSE_07718 [Fusarium pseudograminearum CS3096]|uniref:Uncharacterized protein n=1 Tax=Fusarium pseudograminearum (strain CS3096) TaxID=1028729 RepID=K3VGK9_FUSPC|nr:hypothetical protein FPSE_07718 [Fusarium pseudograminearum CS3096]EKJ72093.1 hypothetical protein FPSE_07718 [Fusarium pseudograminearum CS3096]
MSLTDNGPTQVPADTIHKAHGVLLCQRSLKYLLKASSEQPLFRSSQPHKAIRSFIQCHIFSTHTIYCENQATLILSNNEDPGRAGAIEASVDLLLMTANMSANRQVSGGYKQEPAMHPVDKAGYILFHHDRGSPAHRGQGRGGQTRQLRQRHSCQTPKNRREEKRRDVAAHSIRSLDIISMLSGIACTSHTVLREPQTAIKPR